MLDVISTVSVIASLAAVLMMAAMLRKRDRQLKQILTMLEARHKAEAELDQMRAVLAPCPLCGERGAYVPDYASAATH